MHWRFYWRDWLIYNTVWDLAKKNGELVLGENLSLKHVGFLEIFGLEHERSHKLGNYGLEPSNVRIVKNFEPSPCDEAFIQTWGNITVISNTGGLCVTPGI